MILPAVKLIDRRRCFPSLSLALCLALLVAAPLVAQPTTDQTPGYHTAAAAYGKARPVVAAQPDGLVVCEAEEINDQQRRQLAVTKVQKSSAFDGRRSFLTPRHRILALLETYHRHDLLAALERAVRYGAYVTVTEPNVGVDLGT